ncbi:hypothetical protein LshimejAT787_0803950 [Lyophyllum shimeji]|uniref:Uncharacterized protein n=1 Tax=Lyophyllum shimeji TaxID=47721 RepID=A0A9P3UMK6_LYOSH|nr:hypothetical protein LshimejAT787_0803950 [Lyophyllum shimeji]
MFCALILVALAGYVSAQLSAGCKTALLAISANPDAAACLTPNALLPALSGAQNTTLLSTIDTWVTNMCSASPCSDSTISAVVKNVTTGCAGDASVSSALLENIHSAQYVYPTVRKIMCLKDSGKNCITKTLSNVQAFMANGGNKPLTNLSDSNFGALIASAGSFVGKLESNAKSPPSVKPRRFVRFGVRSTNQTQTVPTPAPQPTSSLPSNMTCTTCIKSMAQIINDDFPGSVDSMFPGLAELCSLNLTNTTKTPTTAASVHNSASGSASGAYFGAFTGALVMTVFAVSLG